MTIKEILTKYQEEYKTELDSPEYKELLIRNKMRKIELIASKTTDAIEKEGLRKLWLELKKKLELL
jgi:hypothetical protein